MLFLTNLLFLSLAFLNFMLISSNLAYNLINSYSSAKVKLRLTPTNSFYRSSNVLLS